MVTALQWEIADRVTALRKKHNEYQVDLAVALDVSRTFISDVENHGSAYNLNHPNKIALHYKCSLHDLIPEKPMNS